MKAADADHENRLIAPADTERHIAGEREGQQRTQAHADGVRLWLAQLSQPIDIGQLLLFLQNRQPPPRAVPFERRQPASMRESILTHSSRRSGGTRSPFQFRGPDRPIAPHDALVISPSPRGPRVR